MRVRWSHSTLADPWWDDRPVAIIGGGASLKGIDLEPLKHCHTVAVKGTLFDHRWAEMGFGVDSLDLRRWWRKLGSAAMPVWWAVADRWTDPDKLYFPPPLRLIQRTRYEAKLSEEMGRISSGGSSGFGALNVAYLKRAKLVVLFGFDYKPLGGEWHANGSHYNPRHYYNPQDWKEWAFNFSLIGGQLKQRGVEVVNASPDSSIEAFPKVTVEKGMEICLM